MEIAATIIICFFGILSQVKIWKVIQVQREKRESQKLEEDNRRDAREERLGRRLEAGTGAERARWENVYGDRQTDSGVGMESRSTPKTSSESTDAQTQQEGEIEMDQLSATLKETERNYEQGQRTISMRENKDSGHTSQRSSRRVSRQSIVERTASDLKLSMSPNPGSMQGDSLQPKKTNTADAPKVIPLPFKVPEHIQQDDHDDNASVATFASSKRDVQRDSQRFSRRFSGSQLLRNLSKRSHNKSIHTSSSVEALVDGSHIGSEPPEDKSTSSARSISDEEAISAVGGRGLLENKFSFELSVLGDTSTPEIPRSKPEDIENRRENRLSLRSASRSPSQSSKAKVKVTSNEGESDIAEDTALRMSKPEAQPSPSIPSKEAKKQDVVDSDVESVASKTSNDDTRRPMSIKSIVSTKSRVSRTSMKNLQEFLPEGSSKVVLQFRTNEWAKHLSQAETPEVEELSFGPIVDEPATMVNSEELLKTPLDATPDPAPIVHSQSNLNEATSTSKPTVSQRSISTPIVTPSITIHDASPPQTRGSRSGAASPSSSRISTHSQRPFSANFRSSSSPLMTSPIAEDSVVSFTSHYANASHQPQPPTSSVRRTSSRPTSSSSNPNLIGSPDNISLNTHRLHLQKTNSQTSLHRLSGPSSRNTSATPSPNASTSYLPTSGPPSPLFTPYTAQSMSASSRPNSSSQMSGPAYATAATRMQPVAPPVDPTVRRASMLAQWRTSIAQDIAATRAPEIAVQTRREEMLEEKLLARQMRTRSVESNPGGWGEVTGMPSGGLLAGGGNVREVNDAHREVLRRMQAGANARLNSGA